MDGRRGLVAIEALLQFAVRNSLIESWDITQARNALFTLLHYEPAEVDAALFGIPDPRAEQETATDILSVLSDVYAARGFMTEDTAAARDALEAACMGLCMPRTSELLTMFMLKYMESPQTATDYFYTLCRAANYIQVDRIKKDLYWVSETEYGELEITVNLSKPEKDPRDIAAARLQPAADYPRCLLCVENVGFAGTRAWPARQNLRVIPMTLDGDPWYFQYSPYAYYNEHCIVLSEKHEPMRIDERTFRRLIECVDDFPHYFVGSNADLPIVGGSILSHDHFQGGRHTFPMEKAEPWVRYAHQDYPAVEIALVKWPLSVIRLTETGENTDKEARSQLIALAVRILEAWRGYTDAEVGIYAFTDANGTPCSEMPAADGVPHNTITPISRRDKHGKRQLDLVLRNNHTTDEHPLGVFHPHAERHHIKKENIGLIEVMGLAVLPGRLRGEMAQMAECLCGEAPETAGVPDMHRPWLDTLLTRYGHTNTPEAAETILRDEIGRVFAEVLRDCGVFKDDGRGQARFMRFMEQTLVTP